MYEIKQFKTIKCQELKQDWLKLQQGSDMTAFQYYEWYEMLEEEYRVNRLKRAASMLVYLEILKDSLPVIIAPLHIQKHSIKIGSFGYDKNVYFLGMKGYSDYLNFVYRDINREDLDFLFRSIGKLFGYSEFYLSQLPETCKSVSILKEYIAEGKAELAGEESCVKILFPVDIKEFEEGLSKNLKSSLRRQRNKYAREGIELNYELMEGIVDRSDILNRVAQIHAMRFEEKNKNDRLILLSEIFAKIFKPFDEIQYSVKHNKHTWLLLGKNGDEIISYFYGLKDHNAVRIMQLGFDSRYQKYMPGNMTMVKFIRDRYEELADSTFDFTRGEERYKYELGGNQHRILNYRVKWS